MQRCIIRERCWCSSNTKVWRIDRNQITRIVCIIQILSAIRTTACTRQFCLTILITPITIDDVSIVTCFSLTCLSDTVSAVWSNHFFFYTQRRTVRTVLLISRRTRDTIVSVFITLFLSRSIVDSCSYLSITTSRFARKTVWSLSASRTITCP